MSLNGTMSGGWATIRYEPSTSVVSFFSAWVLSLDRAFLANFLFFFLCFLLSWSAKALLMSLTLRCAYQASRYPVAAKEATASR